MNFPSPQDYIGQKLTPELLAKFKELGYRVKRPGYMYTQDYKPWRVNIHVNADGIIERVSNG